MEQNILANQPHYSITTEDGHVLDATTLPIGNTSVRVAWDTVEHEFYFSIVDVVAVLTEQVTSRGASTYWAVTKNRLKKEGSLELLTICKQLKLLSADGKYRFTDVAKKEQLLRIVQSIPSKKAEPIKQWLAQVGAERIDQVQDPELSIDQAIRDYRRLGYSETWINQRIKTIEVRKKLTDEWKERGIIDDSQFGLLTNLMYKTWSGFSKREYMDFKGLHKENLRDNMTDVELLLNALAEASATEISKKQKPNGLLENAQVAQRGATIAKNAREDLETQLGESVISPSKALDHFTPQDELPFDKDNHPSNSRKK